MPPAIGTPWIWRPRNDGLSSTATTGTRPSCGLSRTSRNAAEPVLPAPMTATRTPLLRSPKRRKANSRDWKRTKPNKQVATTGPAISTEYGTCSEPHPNSRNRTAPAVAPAHSKRRASSMLA